MTVPTEKVTKLLPAERRPDYLQEAIAKGASVETIERIMAMQERWEANEARKAFNRAIAEFKRNPPEILKTTEANFGGGKATYKYAELSDVFAAVDPALAAHGLWARYKMRSDGPLVTVTCVIGHNDGHSEEPCTLSSAPDTSGNKNAIQAIGSAVSYLQRYTLTGALGMAAARDDDGRRSGAKVLTPEHLKELNDLLGKVPQKDVDKFMELAGVNALGETLADMMDDKFEAAKKHLQKKVKENEN